MPVWLCMTLSKREVYILGQVLVGEAENYDQIIFVQIPTHSKGIALQIL